MAEMELLISISNEVELGLITTILKNNNIVFITKDSAAIGGYMKICGCSIYGTDIFVEKHEMEIAKDLIGNFLPNDESNEELGR